MHSQSGLATACSDGCWEVEPRKTVIALAKGLFNRGGITLTKGLYDGRSNLWLAEVPCKLPN
jgi:hypothetical protein